MQLGGFGKGLIGVDITSASVKFIELKRVGGRFQIESYAIGALHNGIRSGIHEDAAVEHRIQDMGEVVDVLKRLIEHAKPRGKRAVVAVPSNAVITKMLTLPLSLDDDDIEACIKHDSDKHIPFSFNDAAFDFQRLGVNKHYADQQDVLLVACRQKDALQPTEAVTLAGLTPAAVDAEAFAIERAFAELSQQWPQAAEDSEGVALVDVGANMNTFYVIRNGRIAYSRVSSPGGRTLTDEIRHRYGLSFDEAERVRERDSPPEHYLDSVMGPFREVLVKQVSRSLQLYYTSDRKCKVRCMVLVGGTSRLPELAEHLAEECRLEVVIADPLYRMTVSSRLDAQLLSNDAPALLTACGLAMRGAV